MSISNQLIERLSKEILPSDVEEYKIAQDGGMIYDPLTIEAIKTGIIGKYENSKTKSGKIDLDDITLVYEIPEKVTAYDVFPIKYEVKANEHKKLPIHISATAFEEVERLNGKKYYDLNLPGKVDADFTFEGFITAEINENLKTHLSPNFVNDKKGSAYPYYNQSPLTYSKILPKADLTWFKVSYKNVGDTIWDADGNGSFFFEPLLYKMNKNGEYEAYSVMENLFQRIYDVVYPGETGEFYITFAPRRNYPNPSRSLEEGKYKLIINASVRNEFEEPNFMRVVWNGTPFSSSSMEFEITAGGGHQTPTPFIKDFVLQPRRNKWLHKFEEFMSSFDSIGKLENGEHEGIIYVQPAPWTTHISLRVLRENEHKMEMDLIPIEVESDSIEVKFNPDNKNFVIKPDGTREPMILTQMMADMRGNTQITPFAAENIINDLYDMFDAGVNFLTTTVGFAVCVENYEGSSGLNINAFEFGAECLRQMKVPMEAPMCYPFGTAESQSRGILNRAELVSGEKLTPSCLEGWADPVSARATGIIARYVFDRYGDTFQRFGDGALGVSMEDSRGWLRYDSHNRKEIGDLSRINFIGWLKGKYKTIKDLNEKWNSNFENFEDIDPEKDGIIGDYKTKYEYPKRDEVVFQEYSAAMADFDIFRTLERIENYKIAFKEFEDIKNVKGILRTEGGNWLISGIDPFSTNPKERHIFYSQRHCAMIAELLQESETLIAHADYTTLPYTETEICKYTKMSVEQGILPMHMPQFNRMRDVAINSKYGEAATRFVSSYNLNPGPNAVFVNTITSAFQWFKAIYENGGAPGILWQDYLCDGYTTSTQYKEMKFFKKKLDQSLETPEAQQWKTNFEKLDDDYKSIALVKNNFEPEYVQHLLKNTKEFCRANKFEGKRRII